MTGRPVTVKAIIDTVAADYQLTPTDLTGPRRNPRIADARHTAMYITRQCTSLSLPKIAAAFNRKDHTTVLHAVRKMADHAAVHRQYADRVAALIGRLSVDEQQDASQ